MENIPSGLSPISAAERALALANTPEESKQVESLAAAAKAWAKEQDNFYLAVEAAHIYFLARRKTTELIQPQIPKGAGRPGNNSDSAVRILETDFNLTYKQWQRRQKELEATDDDVDAYIKHCLDNGIEPTIAGLLRYALAIIQPSTGNEWYTPEQYIESARIVLGMIDLDPASCEEANQTIRATKFFTEDDDGLAHEWHGRLWMNPPYSQNKLFAEKMQAEFEAGRVSAAVVLLSAHSIETKWFAWYWDHILCFTGHRIAFNTPGNGHGVAGNISGSVFIYLGPDKQKFAKEFYQHGYIVRRWTDWE